MSLSLSFGLKMGSTLFWCLNAFILHFRQTHTSNSSLSFFRSFLRFSSSLVFFFRNRLDELSRQYSSCSSCKLLSLAQISHRIQSIACCSSSSLVSVLYAYFALSLFLLLLLILSNRALFFPAVVDDVFFPLFSVSFSCFPLSPLFFVALLQPFLFLLLLHLLDMYMYILSHFPFFCRRLLLISSLHSLLVDQTVSCLSLATDISIK